MLQKLPHIPLAFLGLGLYRAWIEVVYVGTWVPLPVLDLAGQDLFDASMVVVLLGAALLHRWIDPLYVKRPLLIAAASLVSISTVVNFATMTYPSIAPLVAAPSAILSGLGIALLILVWSELYASLSPYQVAVYYSASILAGAATIILCRGFILPYLAVAATVLPVLSLAGAFKGFSTLPSSERPLRRPARGHFPWQPVALMSLYAFAYGLRENELTAVMGPMSSAGVIIASGIVLVGIVGFRDRFGLDVMQRVALPAMVGSLVFVPAYHFVGDTFANLCASLSYTAFSILIFCILCDLSHRFGFSALLLFGLERGIRAIFSLMGRTLDSAVANLGGHSASSDLAIVGLVAVALVTFALVLWRTPSGRDSWRIPVVTEDAPGRNESSDEERDSRALLIAGTLLRKQYQLTPREEEVLLLLAQGQSIAGVAQNLVIANGTAKVHVRHIYEKLNVHTRDELKDLVEHASTSGPDVSRHE